MQVSGTVIIPITVALIGACGVIAASWITKKKTQSQQKEDDPIRIGDMSTPGSFFKGDAQESNVAIGNNITQTIQNEIHNHIGIKASVPRPFDGKVESKPTVDEIAQAIKSAKPFDKQHISGNHVGISVSWPVTFSSTYRISDEDDDIWQLVFDGGDKGMHSILAKVTLSDQPKLRVIDSGHRAWIDGKTARIEGTYYIGVFLEDGAEITLE